MNIDFELIYRIVWISAWTAKIVLVNVCMYIVDHKLQMKWVPFSTPGLLTLDFCIVQFLVAFPEIRPSSIALLCIFYSPMYHSTSIPPLINHQQPRLCSQTPTRIHSAQFAATPAQP